MDNDHLKAMENEGVEARDTEVIKSSIRKSTRLQSKKDLSPCSNIISKSHHRNPKNKMNSSKESVYKDNSISGTKIEEEKTHQDSAYTPSFEYHVRTKDGINLVVDLNTKRSDWLKRIEKQIREGQNRNFTIGSTDKTSQSDASMDSCVENKFSIRSLCREIGKTLPMVVEKEFWSKVDQNSENSEEVEVSGVSSLQKGSLCSRTGNICSESLLNSTTEVNQEAGVDHSQSTVVNEESIKSAEGMEVSGREDNPFVTTKVITSNDNSKKKKRFHKSDNIHGQSHERILRSTPVFGGKIVERDGVKIRRSSRVQSK